LKNGGGNAFVVRIGASFSRMLPRATRTEVGSSSGTSLIMRNLVL
jgi:hypothetical protein